MKTKTEAEWKFKNVVAEAQDAFWNTIVQSYPQIKNGDFSPIETLLFDTACNRAVKEFLKNK